MTRMYVPKRPAKMRRKREAPAQLELTLELPRGPQETKSESAVQDAERGVTVVDFFI